VDRMPMRILGRSLLESWAHSGAICARSPRTQPVPYICLLVIGECKGLRPRSGLSSIAKREPGHQLVELTDQPRCAALPIRSWPS